VVPLLVDLTSRQDPTGLARKYGVQGIPFMVFLRDDGSVFSQFEAQDAPSITSALTAVASGGAPPVGASGGSNSIPWLWIVVGTVIALVVWHGLKPRQPKTPGALRPPFT